MASPRIVLKDLETDRELSVQEIEGMIGRDPASAFVIDGPKSKVVSGRHARIFFQDNAWWIEDSSRNGTVLDDERLQSGQRHALSVGQVIGLGESGPRLRVAVLESRKVAETVMEMPESAAPTTAVSTTAPRVRRAAEPPEPDYPDNTSAIRKSEAIRAGVRFEEPTEPMSPAPDWLVQIALRLTGTNQRFEVTSMVVKIGRSPENDVQIPPELGASVSRHHAQVAIEGGGVVVRDVGSRNGTYLNGNRIGESTSIAKGDQITLGSGGPVLGVEDLHIVRREGSSTPGGGGVEPKPSEPKPTKRRDGFVEPRTDPAPIEDKPTKRSSPPSATVDHRSFGGVGRTAFFKDVLEDMSEKSAKRVRVVVWASVATTVLMAVVLLGITQWRVAASEGRMAAEQQRYEARADSIRVAAAAEAARLRASFDSARNSSAPRAVLDSLRNALADASRRTGVLEVALLRARESLNEQLAARDSARRVAEEEMNRLRAELVTLAGAPVPSNSVDSVRRALRLAEDQANDVATQLRTVRSANLAQVAQLNQGAVGLLVSFVGDRVVSGSGFAITPSGYFVTNRHVVTDDSGRVRDSIYVTMADQRFTLANRVQVVALGTREVDIAVVKIPDYRGPYMKRVDWAASGASQGDPAALIGFPYGVELAFDDTTSNVVRTSMSAGIFSKVSSDRIQFDGFTVGGSSGSPIFNAFGQVVAVHRAGFSSGRSIGFSIPVSRVLPILPSEAKNELGIR